MPPLRSRARSRTGRVSRRTALTVLLPLLCLAACVDLSVRVSPGTLRVMTYNIRYANDTDQPSWEQRRGPMARQVAFTHPDLVGLQEAQPDQLAYLAAQWPEYEHYGLGRDDGVNGEANTLFWRRDRFEQVSSETQWCSETPDRPSKGWDAALPRTVTRVVVRDRTSGRTFDVRNTHLDLEGALAREECARQVAGIAPSPEAMVIVMGDLNSGPDGAPYRILTDSASGLKDARTDAVVDFGPSGTFNGFDISASNLVAIDHIFVPRAVAVTRYAVLTDSFDGKVISDHFPAVADLSIEP